MKLNTLSLSEAADAINARKITSVELVQACLERIDERDSDIKAWVRIDREAVLAEARSRDREAPSGPLHGIPIGVKDIIDTFHLPTEYGSQIYRGYRPGREAACVELVRRAGAVILGKTVATEFALYRPGPTANPHGFDRTPGGSSSGSAAAVADFQVPVAFGTQTSGSIIRPAAFCGVVGYKPSFGTLSLDGIKPLSQTLDTLGFITRKVCDQFVMRSALLGAERNPALFATAKPRLGFLRTPFWEAASPDTRQLLEETARKLAGNGFAVEEVTCPASFGGLNDLHAKLMAFETARNCVSEYSESNRPLLDEKSRQVIEAGWAVSADEYQTCRMGVGAARLQFAELARDFDAIMTPAIVGEAPPKDTTGDPVFCRIWSLLGVPAVTLPAGRGPNGLPLGIQFVARYDDDLRLLQVCEGVEKQLECNGS
jgi:Asp-tRNA(Asn)/Glu-tRNA(Gln) amidotransferase A subunit family amidase